MVQSWFYRKKSVWQELRAGLTRTALAVCLGVAFVLGGCKNGGFIFGERRDIYNPWSIINFL